MNIILYMCTYIKHKYVCGFLIPLGPVFILLIKINNKIVCNTFTPQIKGSHWYT